MSIYKNCRKSVLNFTLEHVRFHLLIRVYAQFCTNFLAVLKFLQGLLFSARFLLFRPEQILLRIWLWWFLNLGLQARNSGAQARFLHYA